MIAVKRRPGGRVFAAVDGGMSDSPRAALYGASYTFAVAGDAGHSPPSAGLAAMA